MASKGTPPAKAIDLSSARGPKPSSQNTSQPKPIDYTSHGVTDNDVFLLPGSDFQLLGLLTIIGAIVRLFRIYQPSSVVFDEVQ
jgi:dolichyl-phosphate-mannose-protein mannosyltransferase